MGNRYISELPGYVRITQTWGNKAGLGRWWKRLLSKARRRAARAEINGKRARGLAGKESEVNWRGW